MPATTLTGLLQQLDDIDDALHEAATRRAASQQRLARLESLVTGRCTSRDLLAETAAARHAFAAATVELREASARADLVEIELAGARSAAYTASSQRSRGWLPGE